MSTTETLRRVSMPTAEREALMQTEAARNTLRRALIYAYECAGHGSLVTQPLREALDLVECLLREVQS